MIFLDLDGTLLDDHKNLPKENREAIDAALAQGHKVLICTGRPLSSAIKLLPVFGLDKPGCWTCRSIYSTNIINCFVESTIFYRENINCDLWLAVYGNMHEHDRQISLIAELHFLPNVWKMDFR